MQTRRSILASAGATLLAGCPSVPEVPGGGSSYDCASGGHTVSASKFAPSEDLPLGLSDGERRLLDRIVTEQGYQFETYGGDPPLPGGVYVEHDGAFYRARVEQVDETEVPARAMNIERDKGRTPPGDTTVVAFSELPESDQRALRFAVEGPKYGNSDQRPTQIHRTNAPMPYPDGAEDSRLVGAETWVRWDGRAYRLWGDGEETTISRYTFQYDVERVADGPATFREHVTDEYLVPLDNLDDPERAVVRSAVEDSYQECEPASEGLAGLRERLLDDQELPHPEDGAWFVAFDGGRYELSVTYWA